jgi:hypothetical protein
MRDVQTRYLLLEEGPASLAVSPARSCYATFNLLAHCFFFTSVKLRYIVADRR